MSTLLGQVGCTTYLGANMSDLDVEDFKLFDALNQKNFNINPAYIQITGDILTGFFLTQLCFLARYHNWGEFSKSDSELEKKYFLSRKQLGSRREALVKLGIIKVELKGYPAVNHYTINISTILGLIKKLDLRAADEPKGHAEPQLCQKVATSCDKRAQLDVPKGSSIPYNDQIINNNNAVVDLEVKELGNKLDIPDDSLTELSLKHDKKAILKHLKSLSLKKRIINPIGWLKNALENNYQYSEKTPQSEPRFDLSPYSHQIWSESKYQQELKARERLTDPNDWREKMIQDQLLKLSAC